MQAQIDSSQALLVGLLTSLLSIVFDAQAPTIFAGFGASVVAVAVSKPMTRQKAIGLIIAGTLIAAWCSSTIVVIVDKLAEKMGVVDLLLPEKGVAFALAFVCIYCPDLILESIRRIVRVRGKQMAGDSKQGVAND